LVAADRRRLSAHIEIKVTPNPVSKWRDASHPLREIVVGHEPNLFLRTSS
jgi:hypothetical protein